MLGHLINPAYAESSDLRLAAINSEKVKKLSRFPFCSLSPGRVSKEIMVIRPFSTMAMRSAAASLKYQLPSQKT